MNKNILKLINSSAGRYLLGIKHNLPIVRFDDSWVEMWTGKYKDGKPLMKATVWTFPRVAEEIIIPYKKFKKAKGKEFPLFNRKEPNSYLYPHAYSLTTTKNPNTGEGWIFKAVASSTWANCRNAATGDSTDSRGGCSSADTGSNNFSIRRYFAPWATSTIGAMIVSAADIQLYRDDSIDTFANPDSIVFHVVPSGQASSTALDVADYNNITFASRGNYAQSNWSSNNAYNGAGTFNLSDFTEISGTTDSLLAIITDRDLNNSAPTSANQMFWQNRGAANPPKLNLTYTLVGGGGGFFAFM